MPRANTNKMKLALAEVMLGKTQAEACKLHGVNASALYRAMIRAGLKQKAKAVA